MAEQLSPLIIFSVVFLGITIVILGALSQVFSANVQSQKNPEANLDVIGGVTYRMWESDLSGGQSDNMTPAKAVEWSSWASGTLNKLQGNRDSPIGDYKARMNNRPHFTFYEQKDDGSADVNHFLSIWVVRNNTDYHNTPGSPDENEFLRSSHYRDFLFVREYKHTDKLWDNQRNWYGIISFDDAFERSPYAGNVTEITFLGKSNITLFAGPKYGASDNATRDWVNNTGTLQVGSDLFNIQTGGKIGMWSLISDLMMFKLQDVPFPMNIILGLPLWIGLSLTVVALVSRFIPTIPGL